MRNRPTKILIAGAGVLAGDVIDFLSQSQTNFEIVVGARDVDAAMRRINLARYAAMNLGHYPRISVTAMDLANIEATSARIDKIRPDIIFNATTLQSWWVITKLQQSAFHRLDRARGGIWTPMHMVLIRRLMKAVRNCNSRAVVINASYPDVVNAALAAEGLAPSVGIGNVANAVPGVRLAAADLLNVSPAKVTVRFFTHHYLSYRMPSTGVTDDAPYHLRILVDGRDIGEGALDHSTLFKLVAGKFRRTKGLAGQAVTASSAVAVIEAAAAGAGTVVHAPGPIGLVGGYPVRFAPDGFLVELPEGLTLDQAVAVNRLAQRFDGINEVADDGTVSFTQEAIEVAKAELGFNCPAFRPEDCELVADELGHRYASYAKRFAA